VPLTGRRAVVTGAVGGIGSASWTHSWRRERSCIASTERVGARAGGLASGGNVAYHQVDLANRADTDRLLVRLGVELGGRCDILVNGAGISRVRPFDASDDALLDSILAINFTAAFRVTRALLPALRASGCGSIVNIASELSLVVKQVTAPIAQQGALLAWSRALAVELAGERIRVNAVCPGPVDTAMLADEFATAPDPGRARREEIAGIPSGRLGAPAEIAAVIGSSRATRRPTSPDGLVRRRRQDGALKKRRSPRPNPESSSTLRLQQPRIDLRRLFHRRPCIPAVYVGFDHRHPFHETEADHPVSATPEDVRGGEPFASSHVPSPSVQHRLERVSSHRTHHRRRTRLPLQRLVDQGRLETGAVEHIPSQI